jgi:hypothetical protein
VSTRHSNYERDRLGFYVEPGWAADAILDRIPLPGGLHDPCCGIGTIVDAATRRDIVATGADIADRANGRFPVRDFLLDETTYPNIVCNPSFEIAVELIKHGLKHVVEGGHVAVLVPLRFLASQERHALFKERRPLVLVFSRRPSMPPGNLLLERGERIRKNGSDDFAWIVFRRGQVAESAHIDWLSVQLPLPGFDEWPRS